MYSEICRLDFHKRIPCACDRMPVKYHLRKFQIGDCSYLPLQTELGGPGTNALPNFKM